MKKETIIKELKCELKMRQKTWCAKWDAERIFFVNLEHQRRYEVLEKLLEMLEFTTEKEFLKMSERSVKRVENASQYVLSE